MSGRRNRSGRRASSYDGTELTLTTSSTGTNPFAFRGTPSITAFPIKQGGLAAQAADSVAETIAAEAGAAVVAKPLRPVLRGLLLTGATPRFMRAELVGGRGDSSVVSSEPLWWPPGKIVGRYLASVLARSLHYAEAAPPAGGLPVEVDLSSVHPTAA